MIRDLEDKSMLPREGAPHGGGPVRRRRDRPAARDTSKPEDKMQIIWQDDSLGNGGRARAPRLRCTWPMINDRYTFAHLVIPPHDPPSVICTGENGAE